MTLILNTLTRDKSCTPFVDYKGEVKTMQLDEAGAMRF